ncbi:sigma factor-like helix-turn-helix DNA-binding protein [Paenibacillus sp. HJGM_3]|uniref:sigma factor-like helix-turn-helix DNA-binding protein n=1 Tax=Paenibacillus sp. HJGM_3 TaxID=3379816 RepID=UPI00385CEE8A
MNREQIIECLKFYKAFKSAVMAYERVNLYQSAHNPFHAAGCRVTLYSDMPMGTGSGSRAPTLTGEWTHQDTIEYESLRSTVQWLDIALDSLTADERHVITLKWMEGLTMQQISQRTPHSERTVKTIHGRSLDKMHIVLRFVDHPKQAAPVA